MSRMQIPPSGALNCNLGLVARQKFVLFMNDVNNSSNVLIALGSTSVLQ